MDIFLKALAGIFVTVVLCLTLAKSGKEISLLLTIFVCCTVVIAACHYLEPVVSLFSKLKAIGNLDQHLLEVLLKAVGISLLAEISELVCSDAGNAALGKTIKILSSAVVLWISVPLFENLISLIESVLEST